MTHRLDGWELQWFRLSPTGEGGHELDRLTSETVSWTLERFADALDAFRRDVAEGRNIGDTTTLAGPFYVGCWFYIVHMGAVVSLFLTLHYSKFAHMLYRTLALVHQRLTTPPGGGPSEESTK